MAEGAETTAPDLDDVADELYGLPRDDFIARRDELARTARAAGDKPTATAVGKLGKPSQAAWLANLVARDHPDEVGALEDLGASLRSAQEQLAGDSLRALSRQRHDLVNAMVTRGRRIARSEGVKIGESVARELERTVMAALADPRAARALAAGRLVTSLEPGSGLGDDVVAVPAGRPSHRPPPRRPASGDDRSGDGPGDGPGDDDAVREKERERIERERARRQEVLDEARGAADAAEAAAAGAREEADTADGAHHRAADVVRDLRERLDAAERDERAAADRAADARDTRDDRDREARYAADALDRAQRRLAEIDEPDELAGPDG